MRQTLFRCLLIALQQKDGTVFRHVADMVEAYALYSLGEGSPYWEVRGRTHAEAKAEIAQKMSREQIAAAEIRKNEIKAERSAHQVSRPNVRITFTDKNKDGIFEPTVFLPTKASQRRDNSTMREQVQDTGIKGGTKSESSTTAPTASAPNTDGKKYWISKSGKRHNENCRYFKTGRGEEGTATDGEPCKVCGG